MRATDTTLRRAVAVSVVLHIVCAVLLVVVVRWRASRPDPVALPGIDTRTPELHMEFVTEEPVAAALAVESRKEEPAALQPPLAKPNPEEPRPPLVKTHETLPPELLALVKRSAYTTPDVVEVPIAPTPLHPMPTPAPAPSPVQPAVGVAQPNMVQPAGGMNSRVDAGPPAPPIHGALKPGQTIVYVLDASGSMGEYGKYERARRALIATIKKQPESVRFQVVVYAGTAMLPLPAPASGCVAATRENVERMELALRVFEPAGRSNHLEGVRAAVALRPDVVLILTDADDLPAAKIRSVLKQAERPITLCVSLVGAERVTEPREVK